jgi:sulfhydrogenase subunit delta
MVLPRPRVGVFKFSSCDGCQLTLLDCERQLLDIAAAFDIAYFPEGVTAEDEGHYDIAFVEGAVTTADEALRIHSIRSRSAKLVTLGACATAGGIQALRNGGQMEGFRSYVYARPDWIDTLETSTPIAAHVTVDAELRGCPISKEQLIELLAALLIGRRPQTPAHATCLDCKLAGHVCVMVAQGTPCLGPVTHAGCGALCPGYDRGCYGCFGPKETANTRSLSAHLRADGQTAATLSRRYATYNAASPEFRAEIEALTDD